MIKKAGESCDEQGAIGFRVGAGSAAGEDEREAMKRILVRADWRPEIDPDITTEERDVQWGEMVVPLFERVIALGGRLIGWGPRSLTADFAWDGLYDAIDFLVDAPLAPELAAGLCHGAVTVVHDAGRVAFVTGAPLRTVADLAQLARPGEVLLSEDVVAESAGRLGTAGQVGVRPGRPEISAWILDPEHPLHETEAPGPPSSHGMQVLPAPPRSHPPSSRAPESEVARQVDRLMSTAAALGDAAPAVFPADIAVALRKRDAASLHDLAESVRSHAAPDAAERLDAMASLASGRSGEALRRLRRAKEKASHEDATARCRAALALGVALASAGRPYEAAIEGLEGLARAREAGDERGMRACSRFLAQVAHNLRDEESSSAWAKLGA